MQGLTEPRPSVWRLTAANGGPMTGPGTNTYILGKERRVIIDPGPALLEHVDAILDAVRTDDDAPVFVLTTHTHLDHSPAAALLQKRCNAELIGLAAPASARQDASFIPQREPRDGELLKLADVELRAVHTPGHASNHVCYMHEASGLLFTGDHVMQGSTVVIPPPDGDMSAYLQSLEKIRLLAVPAIAPGHGTIIDDPDKVITKLVRHRLQREARVFDTLRTMGSVTIGALLPVVYRDVPVALHPVALYSLEAHLLKLESDGRVSRTALLWRVCS